MDANRLVTLTGAGGAGKTRLALQVAADCLDGSGDGVWLVELAAVGDPGRVGAAVAGVLGVREDASQPIVDVFVERGRSQQPAFAIDADNSFTVATIVRRLDGIRSHWSWPRPGSAA